MSFKQSYMIYQKSHKYANIAKSIIIYGITVLFMALASLIFMILNQKQQQESS